VCLSRQVARIAIVPGVARGGEWLPDGGTDLGGRRPGPAGLLREPAGHLWSGERSQQAVALHYLLDKSTVSRQVADLEKRGLLERVVDPDDRRIQTLQVTATGRAKVEAANESLRGMLEERLRGWSSADLGRLAHDLVRFNDTP
jgi:DNA-binding MarR family transcriptional regulator